jgi:hypothetical protein
MARYDKDISDGLVHGKTALGTADKLTSTGAININSDIGDINFQDGDVNQLALNLDGSAGQIIVKLMVDGDDLVFKQYDGYEVARIHDGGVTSAGGGFGYRKRVLDLDDDLDLSSVGAAVPYSGAILSVSQQESDGDPYAITLPTATSAAEGKKILGWHISIIVTTAEAENITVVRGDTSNDYLLGTIVAGDAASSGITIGSHVITFVGGTATEGDRVDITCVAADATNTVFSAQGFCAV